MRKSTSKSTTGSTAAPDTDDPGTGYCIRRVYVGTILLFPTAIFRLILPTQGYVGRFSLRLGAGKLWGPIPPTLLGSCKTEHHPPDVHRCFRIEKTFTSRGRVLWMSSMVGVQSQENTVIMEFLVSSRLDAWRTYELNLLRESPSTL